MFTRILIAKKAQLTTTIIVAATIIILIILGIWAYEAKLPEDVAIIVALESRVNRCITQSANEVFSEFGKSGTDGQNKIFVQNENIGGNVPLYDLTLDATSLANYFSVAISNLTRICIAKADFTPMNVVLLNNPDSLVLTYNYDKKSKKSNVTLNTTLVFGAGNRKTIKLANISATQYPFAFNSYAYTLTKIEEHLFSDMTYYLTNDCEIYNINGKTNITIVPVGEKYTYMEIVDGAPLENGYAEPYVWREVVTVRSANAGFCINR